MHGSDIKEGKIELIADCDGVLKIRRDALLAVNSLGEMMIASRHGDFPVKKGDKIAGTRIIPLVIEKSKMDKAEKVAGTKPIFSILPYRSKKVGIITTGSEVQKGLIKDTGAEIVTYGAPVLPGAMLLLSYYQNNDKIIPILGLPGCVMYARRTVFDLILIDSEYMTGMRPSSF